MSRQGSELSPFNAGYLEDLREKYRADPRSLDEATRAHFECWGEDAGLRPDEVVGAVRLSDAIRKYGHRAAHIDPLGTSPPGDEALEPESYGLDEVDLSRLPANLVGGPVAASSPSAKEAIEALRRVYCSTRGYDYGHIHVPAERTWLQETAESGRFRPPGDPIDGLAILESLTAVEAFERFLHRVLPGKSRFSIEGLDMLVPLLEETLGEGAEQGVRCMTLGMAHRGRLNVLVHVLHKPYEIVMADLRDPESPIGEDPGDESGFRGDVTYHMGARRASRSGEAVDFTVALLPNPSHLEVVDPVVQGMARGAGAHVGSGGPPRLEPKATLPVQVHGDASFPGQGMVAETLNLGRLRAYDTGGTVHIIANNGLGFTTVPKDLYSTHYASDLAKGFDIPVLHVNADDPEAVIEAGRTAVGYLSTFRKDFVIDLVGYRRRGHNESDEPSFTQPLLYATIEAEPTVREKWARELVRRGILSEPEAEELYEKAMARLREAWDQAKKERGVIPKPGFARREPGGVATAVTLERLRRMNASLLELPKGFTIHPKLRSARDKRARMLDSPDEKTIDWAAAEELAFASILADGTAIRLTGQDTERGTFSQRHGVLHDFQTGQEHVPLQALSDARAAYEIANSPLSESAALGFEVGYSIGSPERLTLWEAQYGDFINGAQMVVDELIVSARAKWGQDPTVVLLLPHGYEGHGPDHSSGRIERFLSLAASDNMRIANATTAAQYFHLLRRHAALLKDDPVPLVVFTPKALLRHPLARSSPRDLAEGEWRAVLEDDAAGGNREATRRLLLCSGKIYVDLRSGMPENGRLFAIARLEQLYPFPETEIEALLARYPNLEELLWVQEEPENMGAWSFVHLRLEKMLGRRLELRYVGREASSSPAEGSLNRHQVRQEAIAREAFESAAPDEGEPVGSEKEAFRR